LRLGGNLANPPCAQKLGGAANRKNAKVGGGGEHSRGEKKTQIPNQGTDAGAGK